MHIIYECFLIRIKNRLMKEQTIIKLLKTNEEVGSEQTSLL